MARHRRPPRGREGRDHRRRHHLGEEDLLRRRRPQRPARPRTPDARRAVRRGDPRASRPSCAASRRSASRSSRRSTAPRSAAAWRSAWPPTTAIAVDDPKVELGFPEVTARPAPRRRRRRAHGAHARHRRGADGAPAPGPAAPPGAGQGARASSTRSSPPATSWCPAAKAWIAAQPRRPTSSRGTSKGYKIPGGTPSNPTLARQPAGVPGQPAQAAQGRQLPGARTTSWPRRSRARRSTSTTRSRSRAATSSTCVTGQVSKNMIQAFFFDLQQVNGDRGRPAGHRDVQARARSVVLGAGMMGAGDRLRLRQGRHRGRAQGRLARGGRARQGLLARSSSPRPSSGAARRRRTATRCSRGSRRPTTPADAAGADLVIEAVFEDPKVKAQVFAEIEPHLADGALLGSNTSTLPITGLAEGVTPSRGLHRAALLLPGGQDAAARDHQGREDERGDALPRARLRQADQEDADRRQRQPRLLHQPRDRHVHQRGHRDARRGRARRRRSSRPPRRPATRRRCCSSPTSST